MQQKKQKQKKKKNEKEKEKKRYALKNPQTEFIISKLKAIYSSQQYYFQSLVFLVFPCFLMLKCRCRNLSEMFFYASFSSILSNRPLNPISNYTILHDLHLHLQFQILTFSKISLKFSINFFLGLYSFHNTCVSNFFFPLLWRQEIFDFVDKIIP